MEFLSQIVFIVTASTLIVALAHKFKLPSLLGFLLTGLVLGPVGVGLVSDSHAIELMAEIGVVLLMFTIGLEVSIQDLIRLASRVLGGGTAQMALTALITALILWATGMEVNKAVVGGLLMAASSTALVLRLLGDRGDLGSPYGQLSLAILLMQDFAVVALMLLLPLAAGGSDSGMTGVLVSVGKALALTVGIFLGARFALPWILRRLVELRSREVFLLATLTAVFGTAWVAHAVGLSLALGAFIAGLVISESEFSHQMFAEVLPFRDVFNGLFFVSVGLLVKPEVILGQPLLLLGMILGALLLKALVVIPIAMAFKLTWRHALLAGIALCQVGEFALVLAKEAAGLKLISPQEHGLFIAMSVVTMAITPLALMAAKPLTRSSTLPVDPALTQPDSSHSPLEDHVILIGYGVNGRNVARALRQLGVHYIVVEMNRLTVERERQAGEHIVYGDATRPALLHHLHAERARAFVSAISDAAATREIVSNARHVNATMTLIARTRFVTEIEPLHELGATHVVPEEFETSLELVGRVLDSYGTAPHVIEREKSFLRRSHYQALLGPKQQIIQEGPTLTELLGEVCVERVRVHASSQVVGKTLAELELRSRTQATILAIVRDGHAITAPTAQERLCAQDEILLVGTQEAVHKATPILAGA